MACVAAAASVSGPLQPADEGFGMVNVAVLTSEEKLNQPMADMAWPVLLQQLTLNPADRGCPGLRRCVCSNKGCSKLAVQLNPSPNPNPNRRSVSAEQLPYSDFTK
ncbi:unnamed protein product [Sphacelaria rigidula]